MKTLLLFTMLIPATLFAQIPDTIWHDNNGEKIPYIPVWKNQPNDTIFSIPCDTLKLSDFGITEQPVWIEVLDTSEVFCTRWNLGCAYRVRLSGWIRGYEIGNWYDRKIVDKNRKPLHKNLMVVNVKYIRP